MSDENRENEDNSRVGRRGFFVEGLRNMFKPVAKAVEKRLDAAGLPDWDEYKAQNPSPPTTADGMPIPRAPMPDRPVLRPPGSLEEETFLDTCLTSGQCVSSCPVGAIKWAIDDDPRREGKPFIDPQDQACVVCEDLSCMAACPSGALLPIPKESIEMGLAIVDEEFCVRTHGEDCQICVDKCPLGVDAISISEFGSSIEVHEHGCTGCGVCEMYCPTEPRAITIKPFAVLEAERMAEDDIPDHEGAPDYAGHSYDELAGAEEDSPGGESRGDDESAVGDSFLPMGDDDKT